MPSTSTSVRRSGVVGAAMVMLLAAGAVSAHHGWGSYDTERPLTISGLLTKVSFEQPHVQVHIDADGTDWLVILAPISRMQSRGATEEVVQPGRRIAAYGYPSRTVANELRAERITIDGRTYEMR